MAEFNPDIGTEIGGSFVNASQGYTPNKAIGRLFSGFAEASSNYFEAKQTQTKKDISKSANTSVSDILASTPTEPVQIPDQLKAGFDKLDKYSSALKQGVMGDLEFRVRVDKTAKELRRQYGEAYGQQIDNALSTATGTSTANQLRTELLQEIDTVTRASDKQADFKLSFLKTEGEWIASPNVSAAYRTATGRDVEYDGSFNLPLLMSLVNAEKALFHQRAAKKADIDLAKATGEYTEDLVVAEAIKESDANVTRFFNAEANPRWNEFMKSSAAASDPKGPGGATISPEERLELDRMWNTLQQDIMLQTENMLATTYSGLVKTEAQKNQVRNSAISRLTLYRDSLDNKNYGIFNQINNQNADIKSSALNGILADPVYGDFSAKTSALLELGFPRDLIDASINQISIKMPNGTVKSGMQIQTELMQSTMLVSLSGGKLSALDLANRYAASGLGAIDSYDTLKAWVSFAVHPEQTPENAAKAMRSMFANGESLDFIQAYGSENPVELFSLFASPKMTEKLKGTEIWDDYSIWVFDQFKNIGKRAADTLISNQKGTDYTYVSFDGEKFVVKYEVPAKDRAANQAFEPSWFRTAKTAADNINTYIRLVKPIAEENGVDIMDLVSELFNRQDIQKYKKEGNLFTRMNQAILDAISASAKEAQENPPPKLPSQ